MPESRLPALLVDANRMGHLLVNLIGIAISYSQVGSEIRVTLHTGTEFCELEIENQMAEYLSTGEPKTMFGESCNHGDDKNAGSIARFSQVKIYADCMNLGLHISVWDEKRFRIRVSNIKLV